MLQSKLFPQYFTVAVFAGILQMGTLAFGIPGGIGKAQLLTLGEQHCVGKHTHALLKAVPPNGLPDCVGSAVAASVANWLYVEPVSTNLMFER